MSDISEVPAPQGSSKRSAKVDHRPIDKNKKQRYWIDELMKAKDRLRKKVGRAQTKIHTLEVNLAQHAVI
jgi:hypothetical protein